MNIQIRFWLKLSEYAHKKMVQAEIKHHQRQYKKAVKLQKQSIKGK